MTEIENDYGNVGINLLNVHNKFRKMVSMVPILWEKNEILLRELVRVSISPILIYF